MVVPSAPASRTGWSADVLVAGREGRDLGLLLRDRGGRGVGAGRRGGGRRGRGGRGRRFLGRARGALAFDRAGGTGLGPPSALVGRGSGGRRRRPGRRRRAGRAGGGGRGRGARGRGARVVDVVEPTWASAASCASATWSSGNWACCSTGRNRSSAVWPTRARARSRFFTPGSWTTMASPWRVMSGSATPRASTRSRMMVSAWSSCSSDASPVGASTTDTPPWRSRPSSGLLPATRVAIRPP